MQLAERTPIMPKRFVRSVPIALVTALVLALSIPALAATKTIKKSTGDISKGIPDEQAISQKLVISKAGKIKDVNVIVAVDHVTVGDISLALQSPSGRIVHLSSGNGKDGNGYGSGITDGCASTATFDDEGAEDVADYNGVDHTFSGGYKPESWFVNNSSLGLAQLDGTKMKGTWKLIVMDTEEFAGGALQCFKLKITYQTPS